MHRSDEREVATRYTRIAEGMDRRVEGCTKTAWESATCCPGWTTRDVVAHVVGVHRMALALLDGGEPAPIGPHEDVAVSWKTATKTMRAALRDAHQATRVITTRFGTMPFEDLVSRMICSDTLVHTWDIARATGQDEQLDAAAVEIARSWMEEAGDRLRASGAFGPAVSPPPGADPQTRLLCFLGRTV